MTRTSLGLMCTAALLLPAAAAAQSAGGRAIEGRVGRLESEMRAVQRRVFPNGPLVQPEIEATRPALPDASGAPASQPLDDLTARVSSLEAQVRSVTGQVEQLQYRQRQMEEQVESYRRGIDGRLKALESGPAPIEGALPAPAAGAPSLGADGAGPASGPAPRPSAPPPRAGTDRAARLGAVVQQDTGDAGEDAYLYGYRLWEAKLYPEAEEQLKKVVATYPRHRRASFAQNLLGRAYLDDGKPSLASIAFYDNYKKMPDGERAPESLLYLGQALTQLKKPADACKVYDELTDVYGARLSAGTRAGVTRGRTAARCK